MTELVSASKPSLFILRKAFLWVLSKLSKKLQKKVFPLDLNLLDFEVKQTPKIYSEGHKSYMTIDFKVSNYSPYYDYQILSISAECWIWQTKFMKIMNVEFLDLKSGSLKMDYSFNQYIGISGEERAKECLNGNEVGTSTFKVSITLLTPFGVQNHKLEKQIQVHFIEVNSD